MRIDSYGKIDQAYNTKNIKNIKNPNKIKGKDSLEISQNGQSYHMIKQIMVNTPDIREDKVAQIKDAMNSGTYNVNNEELVNHIIERNFEARV
ncbi:MAG TPA: flagellar biosynthesis anti-sigma factor FlgM [Clostridiales bacterium]|nr:flagellar biosynthesis anti-sigma factor FlgM [Clostridiales bacterium]